jgi:hypothetical protein
MIPGIFIVVTPGCGPYKPTSQVLTYLAVVRLKI